MHNQLTSSFSRRHAHGWETVDHFFDLPLDQAEPNGRQIKVYGREVRRIDGRNRPWLVFLQGGPGGRSPRPTELTGWLSRACEDYRVLLLDQRGTGRSSMLNRQTLPAEGDPAEQARFLQHFRADSIVRDCELIRARLVGQDTPWTVLGQSFGGFCATTYLSYAPDGLDHVMVTGGVPSLSAQPEEVYQATLPIMRVRNDEFYERYPGDESIACDIADHLGERRVTLPGGDPLSVRRLQYLGIGFGMSDGYEVVHYLLADAWARPGELSDQFLHGVEQATSLTMNPLFALLIDACCAQQTPTRWAADPVLLDNPDFAPEGRRLQFTAEMLGRWVFEEYGALRPLMEAADELAEFADWPPLYAPEQLAINTVPVAATIYENDPYVPRVHSIETANQIPNLTAWVTSEYEHDALRRSGERVFDTLERAATGGIHLVDNL
jgi:pimeloyl-ACP methyl ester carboxylesterase